MLGSRRKRTKPDKHSRMTGERARGLDDKKGIEQAWCVARMETLEQKGDRRWREVAAVVWKKKQLRTRILDGAALLSGELQSDYCCMCSAINI